MNNDIMTVERTIPHLMQKIRKFKCTIYVNILQKLAYRALKICEYVWHVAELTLRNSLRLRNGQCCTETTRWLLDSLTPWPLLLDSLTPSPWLLLTKYQTLTAPLPMEHTALQPMHVPLAGSTSPTVHSWTEDREALIARPGDCITSSEIRIYLLLYSQ